MHLWAAPSATQNSLQSHLDASLPPRLQLFTSPSKWPETQSAVEPSTNLVSALCAGFHSKEGSCAEFVSRKLNVIEHSTLTDESLQQPDLKAGLLVKRNQKFWVSGATEFRGSLLGVHRGHCGIHSTNPSARNERILLNLRLPTWQGCRDRRWWTEFDLQSAASGIWRTL